MVSDCKVAKVGPGITSKTIKIGNVKLGFSACRISGPSKRILECPSSVDKSNWLGGYTRPDKFSVVHYGYRTMNGYQRDITVRRTDSTDGWEMDLQFLCCPKKGLILNFHVQCFMVENIITFKQISYSQTLTHFSVIAS